MRELTQFNFHGEGVRVVADEHGEPWFVAADVAVILGYSITPAMVRRLDDDEKGMRSLHTPGGEQLMTVITEPGLYTAILGSQAPGAREFKRWVTHEVLPSIRRTGSYSRTPELTGPELMARALIEAQSTIEAAQARVAELEPPAQAWEALASADGDWSLRDAAQVLSRDPRIEVGQNRLAKLLREVRWIDQRGIPYQVQVDNGRIASRARTYPHPRTGERMQADPQVRITGKGLTWLHKHLGGVEPLSEQPALEVVS